MSSNKMGVDFLVYGVIVAYFAFVVRIVGRKKMARIIDTVSREKQKQT